MKIARLLTLAAVPVVLVACRTDDDRVDDTWTDPALTTEPADTRADAREETISLDEVAGSGVHGEAEIRQVGAQAQVLVRIEDGGPNVTYSGGVYRGTCEMPGERVAQLERIQTTQDGTGQAMSTVNIPGWGTAGATATPQQPTPGAATTPQDPAPGAAATPQQPGTAPQPGTTAAQQDRLVVAYHRGDEAPQQGMQPVVCGELRGNGTGVTGW
jgi:hypothetical protein